MVASSLQDAKMSFASWIFQTYPWPYLISAAFWWDMHWEVHLRDEIQRSKEAFLNLVRLDSSAEHIRKDVTTHSFLSFSRARQLWALTWICSFNPHNYVMYLNNLNLFTVLRDSSVSLMKQLRQREWITFHSFLDSFNKHMLSFSVLDLYLGSWDIKV